MWLFPSANYSSKGAKANAHAYTEYLKFDRKQTIPSFDGTMRIWRKSDPATTAIFDRESVEYIVNSEEGECGKY